MRSFSLVLAVACCGASLAAAQDRPRLLQKHKGKDCATTPYAPADCPPSTAPGQAPLDPNRPMDPAAPPADSSFQQALASAGEGGTQSGGSYAPAFFGDLISSAINQPGFSFGTAAVPNVAQAGGIKIAEGDSPRPMDRVYYNYNYFGNVDVTVNAPAPLMQVNRHVIGLEKTLFGENVSLGMRLPFFTFGGAPDYATGCVGDLTFISKLALLNNRNTGNLLSVGLAVTTPTGGTPEWPGSGAVNERHRTVTLTPFFGYIFNPFPRLFVQGFHSVSVPTDTVDVLFMSNGISTGYWLYRNPDDGIIQGIIPTFEVHVNTPFTHLTQTGAPGDTFMDDSVNLTMGGTILMPRCAFGGAVGVPLAYGPHRIEALATVTLRY